MNILLADDESLVRAGLRSMLDELDMPVQVIGETRNGTDTVAFVEEHHPDLVFVDIRMPNLNGLEAIAQGKTASPYTKWIILSGYSEFQYAKEALRLGASNYLLKPVSLEELKASMIQVREQHRNEIIDRNRQFEHSLVSWMQGRGPAHEPSCLLASLHCKGIVFYVEHSLPDKEAGELLNRFAEQLQHMIQARFLSAELHVFTIPFNGGNPAIFWAWHPASRRRTLKSQQDLEEAVHQWIKGHAEAPYSITAVQFEECSSLETIMKQLEQLRQASSLRALLPIGGMYRASELQSLESRPDWVLISAHLDHLCQLYRGNDYIGYAKAVAVMEKEMIGPLFADPQILRHINAFLSCSIGISLPAAGASDEWFGVLQNHGDRMLSRISRNDAVQQDMVQRVIAYVDQHYMHDIGIKQIAEEFQVTPNYLSSLFHKKHGRTFIKYLTETRMLKAKELLLREPQRKVLDVAEAVGYYSTRHFTKLFTEHFGCYPSEIREKIGHIHKQR